MKIEDYEKKFGLYGEFAKTVGDIISVAINAANGAARMPLSIQTRAKDPARLRARLAEKGILDSDTVETDRKDLAGTRLIFYTNNDVDLFQKSGIIFENFDVEHEQTKVHHPAKETEGNRYQGIHYIVRLKADRAQLPEYSKYAGLRCEIQIQTILNHAWSETQHDIVYKDLAGPQFGTDVKNDLAKRFDDIMDKYLSPAGYEIQRIQHDYNRMVEGKKLFDRGVIESLRAAKDNNERYELLVTLRDYTIPHYDDLPAVYEELRGPLVEAALAARATPVAPFDTTFGQLRGFSAKYAIDIIIDIFGTLRYIDVVGTFEALRAIYREQTDTDVRKKIVDTVRRSVEYNIRAWKQVGYGIQWALADHIDGLSAEERATAWSLVLTVWGEILRPEITDVTSDNRTFTISTGSIPVSEALAQLRNRAMDRLFSQLDLSVDDSERRKILYALDSAARTSHQGPSNDMLKLSQVDAKRIVDLLTERVPTLSYEILENLEHKFHLEYWRAKGVIAAGPRFNCEAEAQALVVAIEAFRDRVNADELYVKYKTLVGFEGIFPEHWTNEHFDFNEVETYRRAQFTAFIRSIDEDTAADWLPLLQRCASTKSNDGATFPMFIEFLRTLAKEKPEIASGYISQGGEELMHFLPFILDGLYLSGREDIYRQALTAEVNLGIHLASLASHFRNSNPQDPDTAAAILQLTIDRTDDIAVTECLVFSITTAPENVPTRAEFFHLALAYLTARSNARWIRDVWFRPNIRQFLAALSDDEIDEVLENLLSVPAIDTAAERTLGVIASTHARQVWDYFGKRLAKEKVAEAAVPKNYEAIPFELHSLNGPLSADAPAAVAAGRAWFAADSDLFRFRGGNLLRAVFRDFPAAFADELLRLIETGDDADADFVLEIMLNYHGEVATHEVFKAIVAKYPADDEKLMRVRISIENSGVVEGIDGRTNSLREKMSLIFPWRHDPRADVASFGRTFFIQLSQQAIAEQRRADAYRALRDGPDTAA